MKRTCNYLVVLPFIFLLLSCGKLQDDSFDPFSLLTLNIFGGTSYFLYVPKYADDAIDIYKIDRETGAITVTPESPAPAGDGPVTIAADPGKRFIYTANTNSSPGTLSAYTITRGTGALVQVAGSPYVIGNNFLGESIVFNPSGTLQYVSDSYNHMVHGFNVAPGGMLTPIAGSPFLFNSGTDPEPKELVVDPGGNYLCVGHWLPNPPPTNIKVYTIAPATGALNVVPLSAGSAGENPNAVALHAAKRVLYVAHRNTCNIAAFNISLAGALSPIDITYVFSAGAGKTLETIVIHPSGDFLYAGSSVASDNIQLFTIGANGSLAGPTHYTSAFAAQDARSISITPDGRYLYAACTGNNRIAAFSIASDGSLTELPWSPFNTGTYPSGVLVVAK